MLTVPTLSTLSESQETTDTPLVFPDRVNGLAQYVEKEVVMDPIEGKEKIIEHSRLSVVGGGSRNLGYIKLVNLIDLEQMQSKSNRFNLNAIIRYHPEDLINDAAVYRGLLKNPDIEDDPGKEEIIAVLLVNNHGLKLLALNQKKTNSRDVVFFAIPTLRHLVVVDVTEIYYKEDATVKRIDDGR